MLTYVDHIEVMPRDDPRRQLEESLADERGLVDYHTDHLVPAIARWNEVYDRTVAARDTLTDLACVVTAAGDHLYIGDALRAAAEHVTINMSRASDRANQAAAEHRARLDNITALETRLAATPPPTPRVYTLDQIKLELQGLHVENIRLCSDKTLRMNTRNMKLKPHAPARFGISRVFLEAPMQLPPVTIIIPLDNPMKVAMTPTARHHQWAALGMSDRITPHPHVIYGDGSACLGGFNDPYVHAVSADSIQMMVVTLLLFLQQCDSNDAAGKHGWKWAAPHMFQKPRDAGSSYIRVDHTYYDFLVTDKGHFAFGRPAPSLPSGVTSNIQALYKAAAESYEAVAIPIPTGLGDLGLEERVIEDTFCDMYRIEGFERAAEYAVYQYKLPTHPPFTAMELSITAPTPATTRPSAAGTTETVTAGVDYAMREEVW